MDKDPGNAERAELRSGETLTSRTISGVIWTFSGGVTQALLKIVVLAILARLLTPGEFGLVGAAMVVVAFADMFGQIGVPPAIVQTPDLSQRFVRTGFTLTVLFGCAAGAAVHFLAPWIAALFRMGELEPVLEILALIFPLRSFGFVAEALLQRRMRFGSIAMVALAGYAVGYAGVAITLAFAGFGVWALVLGQLGQSAVAALGFLICARHSMLPMLDGGSLKKLGRFGSGVTLARLGNYVATNGDYFIVGRWLGPEALGFYSRAYFFMMQPTTLLGNVGDKVLYPALATVQTEPERLMRGFYRSFAVIALVTLPLSAFVVAAAPEIVQILLGDKWDAVIVPLQLLFAVLVFRTLYKTVASMFRARGAVYVLAVWQWGYALAIVAGAWAGHFFGIAGVAAAVAVVITVSFWIGLAVLRTMVPLSLARVAGVLLRLAIPAVAIGLAVAASRGPLAEAALPAIAMLVAEAGIAGVVGLAFWVLAPGLFGEERRWIHDLVAQNGTRMLRKLRGAA